jgi:hypothetical protein
MLSWCPPRIVFTDKIQQLVHVAIFLRKPTIPNPPRLEIRHRLLAARGITPVVQALRHAHDAAPKVNAAGRPCAVPEGRLLD